MLRNVEVTYGTTPPQACKLHGELATRFGTLIDPNGHRWLICAECIDALWSKQQFVIRDEEVNRRARQLLEERLLGGLDDV
jgi:hypothetical protein